MSFGPSLWKFTLRVQKVILPTKTWMFYMTWSWFWGCCVYCHHLSVPISSSRLHKAEMFLYVILWRLSSWPDLNDSSCIVIILPSLRMLPLTISMQLETWQMQQWFFIWMAKRMHNTLHFFLWTQVLYL